MKVNVLHSSTLPTYYCTECDLEVPLEQYLKSHFCPYCGKFLSPRLIKPPTESVEKTGIPVDEVDVESLFDCYLRERPIDVGGGVTFSSVPLWIAARKQAYKLFKDKFSPEKLHDHKQIANDFKKWLLFRNNLSWTTLHRTGYYALEYPERLANLLFLLQQEGIDVSERVHEGIKGKYKVYGIGQGILTGLLHTFNYDNYCVVNNRTEETIDILQKRPLTVGRYSTDVGRAYVEINSVLKQMAERLNTDLTTLDGFMWFISKKYYFLKK